MANNERVNRRKILIVDRAFQYKFIAKFFSMIAAGALLMGSIVYFFCGQTVTTVFKDSRLKILTTADFILPGLWISASVVIAVVGVATALIALYLSHRIAGPVYRIQQDLANFRAGNLKKVFCLREDDEIKPLADSLNEMARDVRRNVAAMKAEADHLENLSGELSPKAREHLKNLKSILDPYHV